MAEEKIYTIPLKKAFRKPFTKRAPYAIKLIRQFLQRHTKIDDIKLGKHLNEAIWNSGIKKPPRRVKVKVLIDKDVKAELSGFEYEEFKADEVKETGLKEKITSHISPKAMQKRAEEKLIEKGKKPTSKAIEQELKKEMSKEK